MRKRTLLKDLNLDSDFLFAKVMSDLTVCKRVLEKLLGITIEEINFLQLQRSMKPQYDAKAVRLDIYVRDSKGCVYNIEMQAANQGHLPKRSRYYTSCMDLDLLLEGKFYETLPNTYVIFFCTKDIFGKGRHVYTFEKRCQEDNAIAMGDEAKTIFVNTKGTMEDVNREMWQFLRYIESSTAETAEAYACELVKLVHKKVTEIKNNPDMEVEYLKLLELEWQAREEGRMEERKILIKAHIDYFRESGSDDDAIFQSLVKVFHLSEEEARESLNQF